VLGELDEDACVVVVAPAPAVPVLAALLLPVAVLPACVEPHAAAIAKSATVPNFVRSR
jgi:hypothetical protein